MKTKPNDDQDGSRPVSCILYSAESFTDAGTRESKVKKKRGRRNATISFLQTFDQCLLLIPLDDYYGPFLPIERHRSRWD